MDDDSVDWGISLRGGKGTVRSPRIETQLKCTSQDVLRHDHLAFPLSIKNYDELRCVDYQVQRILIVVLVPTAVNDWMAQSEESLALRRCGYWATLRGEPEVANETQITVYLPRVQIFSVDDLRAIMVRVAGGGLP